MKLKVILLFVFILIVVLISISGITQEQIPLLDDEEITVQIFSTSEGWGYSIIKDGELFIKQPFIPVIQEKTPFKTRRDALITGNLVVDKIKKEGYPAITIKDLERLNIDY